MRRPLIALLQVPGQSAPDLHPVHLVGAGVDAGQRGFLEDGGAQAQEHREQEDRRAHPVEAHPRRLEGVELVGAGEGEEEEHRRDEHHDG
jgi:hypothetical protein